MRTATALDEKSITLYQTRIDIANLQHELEVKEWELSQYGDDARIQADVINLKLKIRCRQAEAELAANQIAIALSMR